MSKILTECCSTDGCGAMVHGEEEIHFSPVRSETYWSVQHGHLQANYAEGLIEDLRDKAVAAGWHCDEGLLWYCPRCTRGVIVAGTFDAERDRYLRALDVMSA